MDYPPTVSFLSFSVASFLLFSVIPILAIVVVISVTMYTRKNRAGGLNIPPGPFCFPLVGETILFAKSHPSTSLGRFVEERVQKYGKIFRTHLMGKPTVISTDLEFTQFILKNDGRLVETNLPRTIAQLFGSDIMEMRKNGYVMKALHEFLSVRHVRTTYLGHFEQLALEALRSWEEGVEFPVVKEIGKVTFHLILKCMFSSNINNETRKSLFEFYKVFSKGVKSFPLDLPGSSFRKGKKAREAIAEILEHVIEERSKLKDINNGSFTDENLDYLDKFMEMPNLTTKQIIGHMLGVIYGGHESVAVAISLAIYFLGTCPKAMKQIQAEHDMIVHNKRRKGELTLTWEDIKQMEFTQHVINETLRLGNPISIVHRQSITDFNFKGYNIPKGWGILVITAATHLDDATYKEPTHFNPWRWQDEKNQNLMMEGYMPFSKGFQKCAGSELGKMEMSVFIHYLVTMYEWEVLETDFPHTTYGVGGFPRGLPIKVYSRI